MSISVVFRFALLAFTAVFLAGCPGGDNIAPASKQLPAEAQALLAAKGMRQDAPIFIRIFKEESELEVWKKMDDGHFELFKTYPICAWSGTLGPKVQQGDYQAPEGFYTVRPGQMNPNSLYHLAFNIGFPNEYDRANGHTGSALMVHGKCKSAGCFAMTDALIEEIYILARESFKGGQTAFQVHAFPFRMTEENMKRHAGDKWMPFWRQLKVGYDSFEFFHVPPKVAVCSKQYLVNVNFMGIDAAPDPSGPCPPYQHVAPDVVPGFENLPSQQQIASRQQPAQQQTASIPSPPTAPQQHTASFSAPASPSAPQISAVPPVRTAAFTPSSGSHLPASPPAVQPQPPTNLSAMQPPPSVSPAPVINTIPAGRSAPIVISPPPRAASQPAAAPQPVPVAQAPAPTAQSADPGSSTQAHRSGKGDMLAAPPSAGAPVSAPQPSLGYAPVGGSNY